MDERKPWELTDEEIAKIIAKHIYYEKVSIARVLSDMDDGFCESEKEIAQAAQRKMKKEIDRHLQPVFKANSREEKEMALGKFIDWWKSID